MFEVCLTITFISDWHIGSGLGDGSVADAVLARDADGIPWIPGTAIKGALREASWRIGGCDGLGALTPFLFGTASTAAVSNASGHMSISDGRLETALRQWLLSKGVAQRRLHVADLTVVRQQTSLDAGKMVVPQSLRAMECGVPGITFTAVLTAHVPDDVHGWLTSYVAALCAGVKSMGADRSRGLGRCRMRVTGRENCPVTWPGAMPEPLRKLVRGAEQEESL